MADIAPLGNCCSGGRMGSGQNVQTTGTTLPGVTVISDAFEFAKANGVAPLGNCCSGGSQQGTPPVVQETPLQPQGSPSDPATSPTPTPPDKP